MKNNIFKNWDLRRFFYLFGGLFFVAIAVKDHVWWISVFGIYYIAMALFKFGCASGNCSLNLDEEKPKKQ